MSDRVDYSAFLTRDAQGRARLDLALDGITCAACIRDVEQGAAGPEVAGARLNYAMRRLSLVFDGEAPDPGPAVERLRRLGYEAHPFTASREEAMEAAQTADLLRRLGVAAFATMNIMLLSVSVWSGNVSDIDSETRDLFHWISALIAVPTVAYSGQPFFRSAIRSLKAGSLGMDVPISLGVLLAVGVSIFETMNSAHHAYFDSATMLLAFLLAGRVLDQAMRRRTRAVAGNLLALRGETARRIEPDGGICEIPVLAVKIGDMLEIRPGDRVPVDGTVVSGVSEIDASLVTGETAREKAAPGASLHSGVLNVGGALTMRAVAAAENSLVAEVNRLLDEALTAKSRYVRIADKAARLYSPIVHLTALLTFAGWMLAGAGVHTSALIAIAVLIITCPCALGLAVPAVQVVAAGALFRSGVLATAGDAIERIAACDTVVFDKTGTLTTPDARLVGRDDLDPALVALAARLARSSSHPLAKALARLDESGARVGDVVEEPGRGVRALVDGVEVRLGGAEFCDADGEVADALARDPDATPIVIRRGEAVAVLLMRQTLRPDAAATVAALRAMGLDVMIVSGDREGPVRRVAEALGVTEWRASQKPADKTAILAELKAQGRRPLMVGDGLNDAPALAAAHASLSPVSASHLAQNSADALMLGEGLRPVSEAVRLSRKALSIMRENLWISTIYNLIAVPIAVAGFVTPLVAAAAMSGSSLIVVGNALRARASAGPAPSARPARTRLRVAEARP